jgi:hypothetical protein
VYVVLAISIATFFVLAPDLLAAQTASVECRSAKPAGAREYWSWRQIDGRQCWYAGRPGRSKDTLHWPAPKRETIGVGSARGLAPAVNPAARDIQSSVPPPARDVQPSMQPAVRDIQPVIQPTAADIQPVIKPKPVTTIAISPRLIEHQMLPAASFDERFAADRWTTNRDGSPQSYSGGRAPVRE